MRLSRVLAGVVLVLVMSLAGPVAPVVASQGAGVESSQGLDSGSSDLLEAHPVAAGPINPAAADQVEVQQRTQPWPAATGYDRRRDVARPVEAASHHYDNPAKVSNPAAERGRVRRVFSGLSVDFVAPNGLADETVLARGGTNTPERFANGSGVSADSSGNLSGVSVNSGSTIEDATLGIPHNQVGVATVGDVRAAGGSVVADPTPYNPSHCLISGCDALTLSDLSEDIYVSRDSGPALGVDLDLIAASRTFLPLLIAEIRRLQGWEGTSDG